MGKKQRSGPPAPKVSRERIYFDASAFNYLLNQLDYQVFLGTRDLQALRKRELLISPVVVWEVLLTPNDRTNDFLVFSAQHLFAPSMLATPTELLTRYLVSAYPNNKINYGIFTTLPVGDVWQRMAGDPSRKFIFDPDAVQRGAALIRRLGTHLGGIADYPNSSILEPDIRAIAGAVHEFYEALVRDGFLPPAVSYYVRTCLYKLVILIALILFVLELDFDPTPVRAFWEKAGIPQTEMMARLMFIFETYPALLVRGPLLEMAVMAYHHVQRGRKSRGAIFDSMHMWCTRPM